MARLNGVEHPGWSFAGLVFAAVRRKLGRVIRPLRIHALNPTTFRGHALMEWSQESARELPYSLKRLVQVRVGTRVGCPF